MSARIKLLWDFHGPDAEKIASHHQLHLDQFAEKEQINNPISGVERFSEMHSFAFLVIDKEIMIPVRDALKPHRAQVYNEENIT